jgi:ribosomal protein S18 acetylase RimI-like enzyme
MMAADGVTIRPADAGDLTAIGALWKELTDFHAARDTHFSAACDGVEHFLKYMAESMESDEARIAVAETDGKVVAYCLCKDKEMPPVFARRRYGLISDLVVAEGLRRRRIGTRMVEAAMKWFAQRGLERIEVRHQRGVERILAQDGLRGLPAQYVPAGVRRLLAVVES